jgi:hypothetical protein
MNDIMKKAILYLFAVLTTLQGWAQFGTAPDFTVTDIEGNSHQLYADILDQGLIAVVVVSATWCAPCWNLYTSDALEDLHQAYGPDGTNQLSVIFYEGDPNTTIADLEGAGVNTVGNWLEGVPYPVVNESPLTLDLNIWAPLGFPTVNVVRPSDYEIVLDTWNVLSFDEQVEAINSANIDGIVLGNFASTCNSIGDPAWADFAPGLYLGQSQVEHELGVYVNGEFVLHVPGVYEDGDGGSFNVLSWDNLTWSGLPEGVVLGAEPTDAEANTQSCLTYSGTPFQEGVFEVTVTGDLMVNVFGNPVSAGVVTSSFTMVITPNANGFLGCTYAHAVNFNPVATIDDGSCEFAGCTDPSAENFEPYASVDNGTCETEPCVASCLGDLNNDGSIGSADLLTLLTTFGGDCE